MKSTIKLETCESRNGSARVMKALAAILVTGMLALLAGPSWAAGLQSLEAFIQNVQSGRTDFTQTVTTPAREGQETRVKKSSGRFAFQRPGRFRFDYEKPFEQVIVADGDMLWLYDMDLNQVTQRPQAQVLAQTPAALIAAATGLHEIEADFELSDAPDDKGLQWVKAVPRTADGMLQEVRVGFDGDALAALEIIDGFGQRSLLEFSGVEVNPALPADTFDFKVPDGADVLRQ